MKSKLVEMINHMSEQELYDAIYTDTLTGIHNRRAFESSQSKYVAIIDMDSLKYINDNYGHDTGDTYLCQLASVLSDIFDENVYRLSGDEFVIRSDNDTDLLLSIHWARKEFPLFSYGTGSNIEEADEHLRTEKKLREKTGRRARRGEKPNFLKGFSNV